jgi:MerR family copper efflux transcriptional regulator
MYIGELGKSAGASPKAIRMYEAMGLLGPIRRQGVYRFYSEDNVRQVRMIRQAQALGFKLSEMSPLLHADGPEPNWEHLVHYLELKRAQIGQEIARLQQLDAQLGSIVAEITSCAGQPAAPNGAQCDLIEA